MKEFVKPRVVVSKCLEFQKCRYNGEIIRDQTVVNLMPFVEFIPVCPEVEIGLGIPRDPIRVIDDNRKITLYQPSTNLDLTLKINQFSEQFLSEADQVDGFILKNRSPSCGLFDTKVYSSIEKDDVVGTSSGLFGGKVQEHFSYLAIEDEGRLKNFTIREHFFTKLFTFAAFKNLKKTGLLGDLVKFQTQNKYLFMAYQPALLKKLGNIVANHQRTPLQQVFADYETELYRLFEKQTNHMSNINVCQHLFGYFSKELSTQEKEFFMLMIDRYQTEKVPLSSVVSLLKSWALRFENDYLLKQSYFEPYPEKLIDISGSEKDSDYR